MKIDLQSTNSAKIATAMVKARHAAGSPAMDMVLTLIVVTDEEGVTEALNDATAIAREHPARIVGVIRESARGAAALDAKIRIGNNMSGESILLRVRGPLAQHAESVVLPLLLPDSPVVVWWPTHAPKNPADDALRGLAQRRLTDSATAKVPRNALLSQAEHYAPGDTDLTWTRLTPWRALLAAALDQVQSPVTRGAISASRTSASAQLLISWLEGRLGIEVDFTPIDSPYIQSVTLTTELGDVSVIHRDQNTADYVLPGLGSRIVPLEHRPVAGLLAEDLRRLDQDDVYAAALMHFQARHAKASAS
ncbi:glucose-6-phosphate dehydrogenase assembly protein OpcA [soil metagenome]